MSEFTDELRDLANEQDAGPNGPEFKKALRTAADMLDEAEKALALLAAAPMDVGAHIHAQAILAKLREHR